MGNVMARGCVGAWLSIAFVVSLLAGCGEVTANGAEKTQACATKKCMGKNCPPPDPHERESDAGVTCVTSGGSGGAPGTDVSTSGAGGTGAAAPTEVAEFSCTVCRRA